MDDYIGYLLTSSEDSSGGGGGGCCGCLPLVLLGLGLFFLIAGLFG